MSTAKKKPAEAKKAAPVLTFTSRKSEGGKGIPEGDYAATILSVQETVSSSGTPQIQVNFETNKGKVIGWYNLQGYEKDDSQDDGYDRDENGERILSDENTEKCHDIFCGLAHDAGIEEGTDFTIEDLVDLEVGISVRRNAQNNLRVRASMPVEEIPQEVDQF